MEGKNEGGEDVVSDSDVFSRYLESVLKEEGWEAGWDEKGITNPILAEIDEQRGNKEIRSTNPEGTEITMIHQSSGVQGDWEYFIKLGNHPLPIEALLSGVDKKNLPYLTDDASVEHERAALRNTDIYHHRVVQGRWQQTGNKYSKV
ncbi:MAG: hypothetical protein Q8Q18_01735 [bacterium]|nr:hypothetical protein [bacterium]